MLLRQKSSRLMMFLLTWVSLVSLLAGCPKGQEGGKGEGVAAATGAGSQTQTVSEKAKVEFYVMSQCPFGTQVENGIAPVLKKMGGDIDFTLDFIGNEKDGKLSSMHGDNEVKGDKVQLCALKYNPNNYMDMIVCMNKNARAIPNNWESCAKETGMNVDGIRGCYEGKEGDDLLAKSFDRAQKRRARGSPTIFLNDKPYRGARSELAFTRAVCEAYAKDKPKLCADIPPPVKVPITIISDKRCKECRPEFWQKRMETMFPGADVKIYDWADADGKKLYTDLKITYLPAILFGKEVEKTDNYNRINRFLSPAGDYLEFRSGAKFDPTKEICDNKQDDTGNGKVDCDDPDCKQDLLCRKELQNKLDVFVMSQCPYGVRALDAMKEVLDNFKGQKVDFEIHYIADSVGEGFKSLHGQPEVDENLRELCAIKHYPKDHKYMDYIWCRNKNIRSNDWKSCTGSNGIKTDVIEKCVKEEGKKLLRDDLEVAKALGISASPTWLANNKHKFSGIDAETIKRNLCQRNKDLKNCEKKLSGPQAQAGGGGACK